MILFMSDPARIASVTLKLGPFYARRFEAPRTKTTSTADGLFSSLYLAYFLNIYVFRRVIITMNRQASDDIPEDTPQYRSMMITSSVAPPMPRAFSIAPPKPLRRTVEPASKVPQQSPLTSTGSAWKVSDLPELPYMYLLERTNVYVECSAQEVADRISECMRAESIAVTLDDDKVRHLSFNVMVFKSC